MPSWTQVSGRYAPHTFFEALDRPLRCGRTCFERSVSGGVREAFPLKSGSPGPPARYTLDPDERAALQTRPAYKMNLRGVEARRQTFLMKLSESSESPSSAIAGGANVSSSVKETGSPLRLPEGPVKVVQNSTDELVQRAAGGDEAALAALFDEHRDRLRQMVRLRLDRRLQGRVDPSDVLQEAYLDLANKLPSFAEKPPMPFFLWLRLVTHERLLRLHRQHLGTAMRDAGREISLHDGSMHASSASLAAHLLGDVTSASRAAARLEMRWLLQEALNGMEPTDREVIVLRHFEELSNDETATVLGLTKAAASKRYVRAIVRLKSTMKQTVDAADSAPL